jgi:hypothetical protein
MDYRPAGIVVDADFARGLERQRNEAIMILRILKGDIDHLGHWLPVPCREMVESFLSENAESIHPESKP